MSENINGEDKEYLWSGDLLLCEYSGNSMERLYAVGNGVDEVLGIYDDSGNTQYLHSNHVGSVTGVTDENGSIAGEKDFTPFGLTRESSGNVDTELGFIGRKQYEEIGLTYIRARFYDPSAGRFITKDPVRDGFNWYSYCRSNPVSRVDPYGLFDFWNFTKGSLQAIGGGFEAAAGLVSIFGSGGLSAPLAGIAIVDGISNVYEVVRVAYHKGIKEEDIDTSQYHLFRQGLKDAGGYAGRYIWGDDCGEEYGKIAGESVHFLLSSIVNVKGMLSLGEQINQANILSASGLELNNVKFKILNIIESYHKVSKAGLELNQLMNIFNYGNSIYDYSQGN